MVMAKRIVAIIGTYRKGRTIDTAVAEVLRGARDGGATTEEVHLLDKHIEFCTNCRTCTQEANVGRRGRCIHNDDMEAILKSVDEAGGLVLASPTNFYNATAIMRRFMERLVGYAYWPWNARSGPKMRVKGADKKAVIITSTACPAFIAKILMPGARRALKLTATTLGAKVRTSLFYGMVAKTPEATLPENARNRAYEAGRRLAESLV
jgi:putative NADPH-quinone reductase